jgi:hypothetical protein
VQGEVADEHDVEQCSEAICHGDACQNKDDGQDGRFFYADFTGGEGTQLLLRVRPVTADVEDVVEDVARAGDKAERGDGDEGFEPRGGLAHLEPKKNGCENNDVLYPLLRPTQPNQTSKLPALHILIITGAVKNCKHASTLALDAFCRTLDGRDDLPVPRLSVGGHFGHRTGLDGGYDFGNALHPAEAAGEEAFEPSRIGLDAAEIVLVHKHRVHCAYPLEFDGAVGQFLGFSDEFDADLLQHLCGR